MNRDLAGAVTFAGADDDDDDSFAGEAADVAEGHGPVRTAAAASDDSSVGAEVVATPVLSCSGFQHGWCSGRLAGRVPG
jgi:hypothetical protein